MEPTSKISLSDQVVLTTDCKNVVLADMISRVMDSVIELKKDRKAYAIFVRAVKIIIDWHQDLDNGFVLTFNDDFTSIRKQRRPW